LRRRPPIITKKAAGTESDPPSRRNTCAIVVTYNPDVRLDGNLRAICGQVDRTIVIDNGSTGVLSENSVAEWIRLGENLGIATALNRGVARAAELGYRWVLTMDQDSRVHADLLDGLIACYAACPFRDRIGVLAANFLDVARHRLFVGYPSAGRPFVEQPVAITSGSLVRLDAIADAGAFPDDYFIDFVDHEFCLRIRRRGWRVVYSRRPLLDHAIGDPVRHELAGLKPATSNHSPLRRYYITRNRLVTSWNYIDTEPRAVVTDLWRLVGEAVVLMLLERERWQKVRAILAGIRDAFLGRMGRRFDTKTTKAHEGTRTGN
jgi:rhamnosyltransferase